MRILVINGPNLDLLGKREPELYGTMTLTKLEDDLEEYSRKKLKDIALVFGRSNREGEIIDLLNSGHSKYDGLVINPAGLSYNSYSLRDSVLAFPHPKLVVHITNVFSREPYRRNDLIAEVADGFVCGLGVVGYRLAVDALVTLLKTRQKGVQP